MKKQPRLFKSLIAMAASLLLIVSLAPVALADASTDCTLTALVSSTALSPAFSPSVTAYSVSLPVSADSVTLTPTAAAEATFTMDGQPVPSKTYAVDCGGSVTATIVVTAGDGTTTGSYTVGITRAMPDASRLLSPGISAGTLSQAFDPNKTIYKLELSESTASVTFTPVKASAASTLFINNKKTDTKTFNLNPGQVQMVYIKVVTANKVQRIYNFTVKRDPSTSADLKSLSAGNLVLTPVFTASTADYSATVPENKAGVTVKAIKADKYATVYIDGHRGESRFIVINNGSTKKVAIKVVSQSGKVQKYSITLYRAPHILSFSAAPKHAGFATVALGIKPVKFTYKLAKCAGPATTTTIGLYQADGTTLVATLLTRSDCAGTKHFTWDGKVGGTAVAAGKYLVKLNVSYTSGTVTLNAAPRAMWVVVK